MLSLPQEGRLTCTALGVSQSQGPSRAERVCPCACLGRKFVLTASHVSTANHLVKSWAVSCLWLEEAFQGGVSVNVALQPLASSHVQAVP